MDKSDSDNLPFAEPEARTTLFPSKAPKSMNVTQPPPKRIFVTGNAGSGKSTLAEQLGELLSLPVFGLDRIVWQAGWKKTPPEQRKKLEDELLSREEWIMEGVSTRIQKEAELVIFLDVPRRVSLWRCFQRNLLYLFRSRPGLPADCPEWKIVPRLLKLIWKFPVAVRPRILAVHEEAPEQESLLHITSPRELRVLLSSFTKEQY